MPRTHRLHHTLAALVILGSGAGRADHFVITATEDSKDLAQKKAAEHGGWVLDTNLYAALTPNKDSVVRGPFARPGDARQELKFLQGGQRYPGAYVEVQLSFMSLERTADGTGKAVSREIDFGSLTIIKRTGEIEHMRVCWE